MALQIPVLDNRTFDDLLQEALLLIPRFAKNWTNHNVHDPGITLVELFAWLSEMQQYHLDQLTDKHYETFYRLIGYAPRELQPASVDIRFQNITEEKRLESGTKIVPSGKEFVEFEVIEDFSLFPGSISQIFSRLGDQKIDHRAANQTSGVFFSPFGEPAQAGAVLLLGITALNDLRYDLQLQVILSQAGLKPPASHGMEAPEVQLDVSLAWEYYRTGQWLPLTLRRDETRAFTREGRIRFAVPGDISEQNGLYWLRCRLAAGAYEIPPRIEAILLNTVTARQIETIYNEILGQGLATPDLLLRLQRTPVLSDFEIPRERLSIGDILDFSGMLTNLLARADAAEDSALKRFWELLPAETRQLIRELGPYCNFSDAEKQATIDGFNQVLESGELFREAAFAAIALPAEMADLLSQLLNQTGCSIPLPLNRYLFNQIFAPWILSDRPVIQVQTGQGDWETWVEVADFENSRPTDPHYRLDYGSGELIFGNGFNGRIPGLFREIRARSYRTSRAGGGNLPAGEGWWVRKDGFEGISGRNDLPASGGTLAEERNDSIENIRRDFNTVYRAVTSEDYETLALNTPGLRVARARTLPNDHPDFPGISFPGFVTVVVVPQSWEDHRTVLPGPGFLATVRAHLERHRLLTTGIAVIPPVYVEIAVSCQVALFPKNSIEQTRRRIIAALEAFLDPLQGGPDEQGWTFGRAVFRSEIYQVIDRVPGVNYVTNVALSRDGAAAQAGNISIPRNGLVYSGTHQLTINLPSS